VQKYSKRKVLVRKAFANSARFGILDLQVEHDGLADELKEELAIASVNLSQHGTLTKAAAPLILEQQEVKGVSCSLAMHEVKKARRLIRDIVRAQFRSGRGMAV
jgi:hypothetical protein